MHEVGIAQSILEAGQKESALHAGAKLMRIGVRIGALSGVDEDALRFAFSAITQGTELDAVGFEIHSCPRRNCCMECGCEFESGVYSDPCPQCMSERTLLIGGEELDLAYVEVEEA